MPIALTETKLRALRALAKRPLFRGARNWSHTETSPHTDKTIRALIEVGYADREVTRFGVPMVRITHRGRTALGQPTAAQRIAAEAAALHARIAP